MKVYCKNCKFFEVIRFGWDECCKKSYTEYDTPIRIKRIYAKPYNENEYNNCKYYQKKWWWIK